jgi:hypothetical protein
MRVWDAFGWLFHLMWDDDDDDETQQQMGTRNPLLKD